MTAAVVIGLAVIGLVAAERRRTRFYREYLRDGIRGDIARRRGVPPARVQLRRRRDARVAMVAEPPKEQLKLPF